VSGRETAAGGTRRRPAAPPVVAPPPGNPRFGGLDALRGMAALAIVLTHCAAYSDNLGSTPFELVYLRAGQLGLVVFFGLSGFLLYRPFLAAQLKGGRAQPFGPYARRRVLRLVPAYWFALTVLSIVPGVPGMFDSGWWKQYLFLGIFSDHALGHGLPQTWSLCIEAQLYVLLPLMVLGIGWVVGRVRETAAGAWALGLVLGVCALGIGLQAFGYLGHVSLIGKIGPGYLWWFGAGMMLAVLTVRPPARLHRTIEWVRAHPAGCWWLALPVFALAVWLGTYGPVGDFRQQQFMNYTLLPFAGLALIAPAIFVAAGGWPRRLMARRTLRWFGLVSYGIFLWHVGVLWVLRDIGVTRDLSPDGLIPLYAIVLTISCGFAAISYSWVERPFYALKNRRLLPRFRGRDRSSRARAGA
jgi:peptidoglycan/LPS O-acetylase OafA/YrhL